MLARSAGFEAIDKGRRVLEDGRRPRSSTAAEDRIWEGNVQLLEHEQRALVQPNFDRLSCAFARLFSMGSAMTFEVRGARHEASYFTSFYLSSLTRGIRRSLRAQAWPRITRFDDRWRWLVTSIVPRFRRFDADTRLTEPACAASSTKRATTRRTPASYRAHRRLKWTRRTANNVIPEQVSSGAGRSRAAVGAQACQWLRVNSTSTGMISSRPRASGCV